MSPLRLGLIAAGLLAVAACGDAAPETPAPPDAQRIVFVGPRFDVWTVRDDGEGLEHIAGEGASDSSVTLASSRTQRAEGARYTWPTWSPDGTRVALSRIPGLGENSVAGLVVSDASGGPERQLHQTRRGSLGFVARDAPHYALWAPTSQFLSFVAPRAPGRGLGLFSVDPESGDPHQVAANAPLYHAWSPDGTFMLAHRREDLLLYDSGDHSTRDLGARSLRYRAPAFSPDGERIAYVVDEGGVGKLVTSKVDGSDRVTVMDVPGEAAFAYSPAGGHIAVATRQSSAPLYDKLFIVDEDGGGADEPLLSGPTVAFYWSPDGSRLAHVALGDPAAWQIIDLASRETRLLTNFTPTPDFLTHLQFFDQFAPSHLVWSADSTKLTFAGSVEGGASMKVWIIDAVGDAPPRSVADGRLAFWVPTVR